MIGWNDCQNHDVEVKAEINGAEGEFANPGSEEKGFATLIPPSYSWGRDLAFEKVGETDTDEYCGRLKVS